MNYLMYHSVGGITGPALAKFMGIEFGEDIPPDRPDRLIRWGTSKPIPWKPTFGTFNPLKALSSYKTRLEQLNILAAAAVKVPVFAPTMDLSAAPAVTILARDFPVGKQPTKGKGITIYPPGQKPSDKHDMYMEFINKDRQFRVHVCMGQQRVGELVPDPTHNGESDPYVWNDGNGYTFKLANDVPKVVAPLAAQAVAALGLHFGAVDIITRGYSAWALEVNSAPGLSENSLRWYAKRLGAAIGISYADMPGSQSASNETGDL